VTGARGDGVRQLGAHPLAPKISPLLPGSDIEDGILDVGMSQPVLDKSNVRTGIQQMHRDGVAERMKPPFAFGEARLRAVLGGAAANAGKFTVVGTLKKITCAQLLATKAGWPDKRYVQELGYERALTAGTGSFPVVATWPKFRPSLPHGQISKSKFIFITNREYP
jgi:hypothetical protein